MAIIKLNSKNCKKAFVFSFLSIFLAFLIFGFGSLYIFKSNLVQEKQFKEARILYVNDEIKYFDKVYLPSAVTFSFYSSLNALAENRSLLLQIDGNYSKLNTLIYEGLINGTFQGNNILNLDNKSFNELYLFYKNNFDKTYNGNFSYELTKLNIYEEKPYYISMEFEGIFNITANVISGENVSWNFNKIKEVSVPIYNMINPEFLIQANQVYPVLSVEVESNFNNWTLNNFNESLQKVYSTITYNDDYKYTLGSSFLNSLLNITSGSYKDVLGFWSFDYDEKEGGIYDTSQYNFLGKLYGNTRLLYTFDDGNLNTTSNKISDLTSYNINGNLSNGIVCSFIGISNQACNFDGTNNYINISNNDLNLNNTNKVTISAWIYPRNYTDSISGIGSEIFRYGVDTLDVIDLRFNNTGNKLYMEIGNHSGGTYYKFSSSLNVSLNKWNFVTGTFNGDTGVGKLYIDGKIANQLKNGSFIAIPPISNFNKSNSNIGIGDYIAGQNEKFNGLIDELAVYSKELNDIEISNLYLSRKAKFIEYKKSLYGKGIEFDGKNDYVNLTNNLSVNNFYNNWSVGVWFKSDNLSGIHALIVKNDPFYLSTLNNSLSLGVFNGSVWKFIKGGNLSIDKMYYVVSVWNASSKTLFMYLNGKLINQSQMLTSISNGDDFPIYLGVDKYSLVEKYYFDGLIDEVKIYNRSLSSKQIKQNYFNYRGIEKGCCNYVTLINPNLMGFNMSPYNFSNISYSSSIFFKYFNNLDLNPKLNNITLFNIPNITSNSNTIKYTNLKLDICMMAETYSIFNYYSGNNSFLNKSGFDGANCNALIREGFY